jgi:biotin synthase
LAVVENLVPGTRIPQDTLAALLESVAYGSAELLEALKRKAQGVLASRRGTTVYYRGLLEFSNLCQRNCLYCGIRAGNTSVDRFTLSLDEIGETAKWCAENGYGSLTLQSGERSDAAFVDFVEQAILRIKAESRSENQPEGLGITLCVGELDEASLRRLMTAGAHRYLLRVETTNPQLYAQLHPGADGGLDQRVANLRLLKRLGFQVGTGVMIGLPGQTMADLAADLHFFYNEGVQMIGMGPYIPHQDTPLGAARFSAPGAENAGGGWRKTRAAARRNASGAGNSGRGPAAIFRRRGGGRRGGRRGWSQGGSPPFGLSRFPPARPRPL